MNLTLIDALIEIAKSDYPHEWARYCQLARMLEVESGRSPEEDAHRRLSGINRYDNSLAWVDGGPEIEEANAIQNKFLDRFMIAVRTGRYSIVGYGSNLQLISIPPELILPRVLLFDRDELQIANTIITGIRVKVRPEAVQNAAPGPKAGLPTPKDRAGDAVLAILNNKLERPPKRRRRKAALARMVQERVPELKSYKEGSIEKMIRATVKDWEKQNPDK